MKWFKRDFTRVGVLAAATVLGVAASTLVAQPAANATGSPICVYGVYYLAPTTLGGNGGAEWVQWTNEPSEVGGSFVFDQHALGGVQTSAMLPAYDAPNKLGYVTVRNLDPANQTYVGWYNLYIYC